MQFWRYFSQANGLTESEFEHWYVAFGVALISLLAVVRVTLFVSHGSKPAAYSAVLLSLLVAGIITYSVNTPLGLGFLSLSFAMALLQIVTSIQLRSETTHAK